MLTLKDFREQTADLPEDMEIAIKSSENDSAFSVSEMFLGEVADDNDRQVLILEYEV
jgi:hypothetical protein